MTDKELSSHIADCGRRMEQAYQRYEETGCFADRGAADGWRILMEDAIKGRSAAQVARMEAERGFSHA